MIREKETDLIMEEILRLDEKLNKYLIIRDINREEADVLIDILQEYRLFDYEYNEKIEVFRIKRYQSITGSMFDTTHLMILLFNSKYNNHTILDTIWHKQCRYDDETKYTKFIDKIDTKNTRRFKYLEGNYKIIQVLLNNYFIIDKIMKEDKSTIYELVNKTGITILINHLNPTRDIYKISSIVYSSMENGYADFNTEIIKEFIRLSNIKKIAKEENIESLLKSTYYNDLMDLNVTIKEIRNEE